MNNGDSHTPGSNKIVNDKNITLAEFDNYSIQFVENHDKFIYLYRRHPTQGRTNLGIAQVHPYKLIISPDKYSISDIRWKSTDEINFITTKINETGDVFSSDKEYLMGIQNMDGKIIFRLSIVSWLYLLITAY